MYRTDCTIQDVTMFPPANEIPFRKSMEGCISVLTEKNENDNPMLASRKEKKPLLAFEKHLEGTDKHHQQHCDLFT